MANLVIISVSEEKVCLLNVLLSFVMLTRIHGA